MLSGTTSLVTGASRGIGRAIARRLAAHGSLVAVHYGTNAAAAAETVEEIRAAGGDGFTVGAELGVPGDADHLWSAFDEALAKHAARAQHASLTKHAALAQHDPSTASAPTAPARGASHAASSAAASSAATGSAAASSAATGSTAAGSTAAGSPAAESASHAARIDVLVNNAAIGSSEPLATTTPDDFDRIFAVNVKAPFFLVQRGLDRIRDGGRIVNISSGVTRIALPETLAYSMTKGALNTFSFTLGHELGRRGITVNAVAPGIVDTDVNAAWLHGDARAHAAGYSAFNRVGQPDDIADVVAFLASPAARWITGQILDATGGSHLGAAPLR